MSIAATLLARPSPLRCACIDGRRRGWVKVLLWLAANSAGFAAIAQGPSGSAGADRQAEVWAATCMACHGTAGHAQGVGRPLAHFSAVEMNTRLLAMRRGETHSTVMRQHLLGYTEPEILRIAQALARWPKAAK